MNHILWWERNLAFSPKGIKGTSWSIIKQRQRKGRQWLPTGLKKSQSSNWVNLSSTPQRCSIRTGMQDTGPPGQSSHCVVTSTGWSRWRHLYVFYFIIFWASLVSQMVKNLPAMQETQVQSLGQEDPLEGETPVSLPGKSLDRGAWRAAVHGVAKSQTRLSDQHFRFIILIAIKFIFDGNSKELIKHTF